jgi:hemoglobin
MYNSDHHAASDLTFTEGSDDDCAISSSMNLDKIRAMVILFYSRTQADPLLGPVFNEHVSDWTAHYDTMTKFWSSAVMRCGTYSGRPLESHRFGGLTKAHFDRWVEIFTTTAKDTFSTADAAIFICLASRMASTIAMRIGVGRLKYN